MEKEKQYNDNTESTYDKVIKDALKVDQIPLVNGKYNILHLLILRLNFSKNPYCPHLL